MPFFVRAGLKRSRNSQRGQGQFPRKQAPPKFAMGLLWWLGALCVLVLSTLWVGETVVEKKIRKFEVSYLEVMGLTGFRC